MASQEKMDFNSSAIMGNNIVALVVEAIREWRDGTVPFVVFGLIVIKILPNEIVG
jgi:hypothetical protein